MESNDYDDDKIYDNVKRIDQELIKANSPIEEYAYYPTEHYTETMNNNNNNNKPRSRRKTTTSISTNPLNIISRQNTIK